MIALDLYLSYKENIVGKIEVVLKLGEHGHIFSRYMQQGKERVGCRYNHSYPLDLGKQSLTNLKTWSARFCSMKIWKDSCLKSIVIIEDLSFRTGIGCIEYNSKHENQNRGAINQRKTVILLQCKEEYSNFWNCPKIKMSLCGKQSYSSLDVVMHNLEDFLPKYLENS